MKCECGKEIANVPDNLKNIAKWKCKECSPSQPEAKSTCTTLVKSYKPRAIFK